MRLGAAAVVGVMLLVAACGGDDGGDQPSNAAPSASDAEAAETFAVSSPAFEDGQPIPDGFTCDGQNQSPPLDWSGVPDGTVELALIMDDPDASSGSFLHWTVWGIDPAAGSLPEAELPAGVAQGTIGTGQVGYTGPCPPSGVHHYVFTLYALDAPLALAEGASLEELRAAIDAVSIGETDVVGTYERTT